LNSLVTAAQLFAIGLTAGFGLQCFFVCAPLILPCVAAADGDWRCALKDLFCLLGGRLIAYIILGAIAGGVGFYIDRITGSIAVNWLKSSAGYVMILLGLSVTLGLGLNIRPCSRLSKNTFVKGGGLVLIGLAIGMAPCLPLVSVMFEITLISKTPFLGALYGLAFGAGTLLASIVTLGPPAACLGHFTVRLVKNKALQSTLRIACGILIIIFGAAFLKTSRP